MDSRERKRGSPRLWTFLRGVEAGSHAQDDGLYRSASLQRIYNNCRFRCRMCWEQREGVGRAFNMLHLSGFRSLCCVGVAQKMLIFQLTMPGTDDFGKLFRPRQAIQNNVGRWGRRFRRPADGVAKRHRNMTRGRNCQRGRM